MILCLFQELDAFGPVSQFLFAAPGLFSGPELQALVVVVLPIGLFVSFLQALQILHCS